MTNTQGSNPPPGVTITDDTGPLQLAHAFTVRAPCVLTHVRFYVASDTLATTTGGTLDFYAWRSGEPASTVTGTLTITGTPGWFTQELSPHLFVPADRPFGVGISLPAGDHHAAEVPDQLPLSGGLLTCYASMFQFTADEVTPDITYGWAAGQFSLYNHCIDAEVAVSEMVHLAPADMATDDVLQIRRTINGTVVSVTPITDAYTVNLHVDGGPLDGTDVDVWVPDTNDGLLSADMVLLKEVADPVVGSEWESSDTAKWVYQGGGVYDCFAPGTTYPEGAKTTRADTPSLLSWSP